MKIRMLIVLFITMILLGSCSNSHDVYLNEENKISLFFDHKAISNQETIKKGFFNLFFKNKFNKNKKNASLYRDTWVYAFQSEIKWPNIIEVRVEEHQPLAQFSGKRFLTQSGHIISPEESRLDLELILINGPEKEALSLFRYSRNLQEQLNRFGEFLSEINFEQGYLEAKTLSGMRIAFDEENFREQLKRLESFISFELLSGKLHNIKSIDMRYRNGISVFFS